jgi:hypothetical protein
MQDGGAGLAQNVLGLAPVAHPRRPPPLRGWLSFISARTCG